MELIRFSQHLRKFGMNVTFNDAINLQIFLFIIQIMSYSREKVKALHSFVECEKPLCLPVILSKYLKSPKIAKSKTIDFIFK